MTLFNLGYQMIGPAWEWQRADIEKEDALYGTRTVKPFCVTTLLWAVPALKDYFDIIRPMSAPPLERDCFDWIEMLIPNKARGVRWEEVAAAALTPVVRYAEEADVQDAVDRRLRNSTHCLCHEPYDPQHDPDFVPLGYDMGACEGLFLSPMVGHLAPATIEWKKRHAHGINKWHLFEDYAHAKTASCELTEIWDDLISNHKNVDDYPLFPVGVGLERHVYASLQV